MIVSPSVPSALAKQLNAIVTRRPVYDFDTYRPTKAILLEKDWCQEYDFILSEYPTIQYYSDKQLDVLFYNQISYKDLFGVDSDMDKYRQSDIRYKSEILYLGDKTDKNYYILGLSDKHNLKCFGGGWPSTIGCGMIHNDQIPYLIYNAEAIIDTSDEPNIEILYAFVDLNGKVFSNYQNEYTYPYESIENHRNLPRKFLKEKTYKEIACLFQ